MKLKGKVKATNEQGWPREMVDVDCGEFNFEIPKHLTKTYHIGRKVQIEVKPK